jgi:hypothetical protein
MRQLIKVFLWIGCLTFSFQSAWAFSLLGPEANGDDTYQVQEIGFNPLTAGAAPPFILDSLSAGPKNLGDGYRPNTPVLFYTFTPSFGSWFGSNGEAAVQQAFDILNNVSNVDSYSPALSEFPLNSQSINYQAQALELNDLKSVTLAILLQELGLADSVRYTWVLFDRDNPTGSTCPVGGPSLGYTYATVPRNYDIIASPLNVLQYSPYVNGELYSYFIFDDCDAPAASPPTADALEIPADPFHSNPPVSSGVGEFGLLYNFSTYGNFFTGLTRDDVAGLRYLISTNNTLFAPGTGYREAPDTGSLLYSTNFNTLPLLYTSNYNALVSAAATNDAAALQVLYPGLLVTSIPTYYTNIISIGGVSFVTNFPYGYPGGIIAAVTNYSTNLVLIYQYSFGNVVTNKVYSKTSFAIQTITFGPQIGQPSGGQFVLVTNTSAPFQSNVVSGDFFLITNGACGPEIVQTNQITLNVVTNTTIGVTNANGTFFVQNLISYFTNYTFSIHPCTLSSNAIADYQGIGKMQFVRVADKSYDYQNGIFTQPITNQYMMVQITNGLLITQTFQRVVTAPDFVFDGETLDRGGNDTVLNNPAIAPGSPSFNTTLAPAGHAGPGTIDYGGGGSNVVITFNTVGPVYRNESSPFSLTGPGTPAVRDYFAWASFDGTTNTPVVYPDGTSIANLAAEAFIQITPPPPLLPNGTSNVVYNVTFTAAGGQPPYAWTLAPGSAGLPTGLNLSSGGVISGTPTQRGTFINIIVRLTDSSFPSPNVLDTAYSVTVN